MLSSTPPYIQGQSSMNPQSMLYHHQAPAPIGGTATAKIVNNHLANNAEVQFSSFGRGKKSQEPQQKAIFKGNSPNKDKARPFAPGLESDCDEETDVLEFDLEEYSTRPNRFQVESSGKIPSKLASNHFFQLFSNKLDLSRMTNIEKKLTARAHIEQVLIRKQRDAAFYQRKDKQGEITLNMDCCAGPSTQQKGNQSRQRGLATNVSHNVIGGSGSGIHHVKVKRRIFMDQ
ncbi:hypothetical protein FGO68_gene13061 [Halteria grandinella]|uniref:Uncharacterized protein n=1 Tax=Halteria grandinella TaxID=5974 RepID=A0A8J8T9F8_HALGN|nr:hypothetical protein FGO68_gene13061 [Halteria grandinella]